MSGPVTETGAAWPVKQADAPSPEVLTLDPGRVFRALRRQAMVIGLAALVGAVLATLMALGAVARYQATVMILLDEERSQLLQQVSALPNAVVTDATIQSEIEIIRSRALAFAVVDALNLSEDPNFIDPPVDATTRLVGAFRGLVRGIVTLGNSGPEASPTLPARDPKELARDRAASILLSQIVVERVERSFVMRLTYTGFDPAMAAEIARTYGDEYMRFQLIATTEVAKNAGTWIRERLNQVERTHIEAASAVQRFRLENNLTQARGNLLTEQQQSELATALVTAATETAALRAQLESYEELLAASPDEMATVASLQVVDDTSSPLIELRREYAETRRSLSRVTVLGGDNHPQAAGLRASMEGLKAEIAVALDGTVAAVRTRYNIARSREESLREELATLTQSSLGDETVMGRLAQLEAVAATYAEVYADYLLRFETTAQQQGFPIASVQIISDAEVPLDPSSPRRLRIVLAGLVLGGLIGLLLAALREMRTRPLRTAGEVVAQCGLPCVVLAPAGAATDSNSTAGRIGMRTANRMRQAIERKATLAQGRIVGLAPVDTGSDVQGVLKLLVAAMVERTGKVMVVDAGGLGPDARLALAKIENVQFSTFAEMCEALASDGNRRSGKVELANWRENWPYTLVVMPPLTQTVIADRMTWILDATVLTIPWGKVSPDLVNEAMQDHRDFRANLAATVLDGAHLAEARRFMDPSTYEARLIHA